MTEPLVAVRQPRPWRVFTVAAAALLMLLAAVVPAVAQSSPPGSGGGNSGGDGTGNPPPGLGIDLGDGFGGTDNCSERDCSIGRIGFGDVSDSLPAFPPDGDRPPVQNPDAGVDDDGNPLPPACDVNARIPVTNSTMWRSGSPGPAGSWFGSITRTYNGCGQLVSTRANVQCALQTCVNQAVNPAIGTATSQVGNITPTIAANPAPRSMVHMDTWFWDEEPWTNRFAGGVSPVSPVTAVVRAVPAHTTFNTRHQPGGWTVIDSIACPGGGTPWTASATSDCTYIYERPSLETGPSGQNYYAVRAQRTYRLECFIDTAGGGNGYTPPSGCGSLVDSARDRLNLPVREAQSVNRS